VERMEAARLLLVSLPLVAPGPRITSKTHARGLQAGAQGNEADLPSDAPLELRALAGWQKTGL